MKTPTKPSKTNTLKSKKFLAAKKEGDMDSRDILTIKGLIRRGEAVLQVLTIKFH